MMKPMLTSQDKDTGECGRVRLLKIRCSFMFSYLFCLVDVLWDAQAAQNIRSVLPSQTKCWCLLMSQVKEESRLGK